MRRIDVNIRASILLIIAVSLPLWAVSIWVHMNPATGTASGQKRAIPTPLLTAAPLSGPFALNRKQYPLADPNSQWVVVDKHRPLSVTYVPPDLVVPDVPLQYPANLEQMQLRAMAAAALKRLVDGAAEAGFNLMLTSGYRSAAYQGLLYRRYTAQYGSGAADKASARAGYSEHQTGWAADLSRVDRECEIDPCFGETPEGVWLSLHASDYGFVLRYPKAKELITGYEYEPWHVRYVGSGLASELQRTGSTLEEYFDLGPAADY